MCRTHAVLQELQAVTMKQCRMAFQLSGKVVALHLVNSTAKAYLCNHIVTVSSFVSGLACQILSLTNNYIVTQFQHTFIPISMWELISVTVD